MTLSQCLVLLDLDEFEWLTMGQLANHLRLDQSTLTRTVNRLVKSGLVKRHADDKDRRVVRIKLTGEGKKVCAAIHDSNDDYCRSVFEHIPPAERETVIRGFETLVKAYMRHES